MSSTFDRATPHPVLGLSGTMEAALKEAADVPVVFMAPAEKRAALVGLTPHRGAGRRSEAAGDGGRR